MAGSFRLNIPGPYSEVLFLESVQEVANYISWRLEGVADELGSLSCPSVSSANGGGDLSGRIAFKDVRSFSDSPGKIVREIFLYLGSAALGSSLAMLVVDLLREEILECLMSALPSGSARKDGVLLIVEMKDGVLRLRLASDRCRSAIHVRAKYTPAFYVDI